MKVVKMLERDLDEDESLLDFPTSTLEKIRVFCVSAFVLFCIAAALAT